MLVSVNQQTQFISHQYHTSVTRNTENTTGHHKLIWKQDTTETEHIELDVTSNSPYNTFTWKYVHFTYVILKWLSSRYQACGVQKGVKMGHMGDTAFLPGQKPVSWGRVGDMAFLLRQKTHITTFKCMINRLWCGIFISYPISTLDPISGLPSAWYGYMGSIWCMIWKLPYNNLYISISSEKAHFPPKKFWCFCFFLFFFVFFFFFF